MGQRHRTSPAKVLAALSTDQCQYESVYTECMSTGTGTGRYSTPYSGVVSRAVMTVIVVGVAVVVVVGVLRITSDFLHCQEIADRNSSIYSQVVMFK